MRVTSRGGREASRRRGIGEEERQPVIARQAALLPTRPCCCLNGKRSMVDQKEIEKLRDEGFEVVEIKKRNGVGSKKTKENYQRSLPMKLNRTKRQQ